MVSTNSIDDCTKLVLASAATMTARSSSFGVNELERRHKWATGPTLSREHCDQEMSHANVVHSVRPLQREASPSARKSRVQKCNKVLSPSDQTHSSRDQENYASKSPTPFLPMLPASTLRDIDVFPSWIRERKDFQVFFPRFSDHAITDEEILQQGAPKEPRKRNIVEIQCIARWIIKIPSMSTFLDLNQATEIAKLARYRVCLPQEYVFRKGDIGDACYLILTGEVYVVIDGEKVASFSKQCAFGDIALQLENATRGADVQAAYASVMNHKSPASTTVAPVVGCELLMIMAEDYRRILARCQTRRRKHLMNWLHTEVTLFRDCIENKLHFVELVSIDVSLKKGEVLYTQGESIGAFYIVRSGRVRLEVDIQYKRRHRWPCGKHKWKHQVHTIRSRVPFHMEESAGFFGYEMFIKGQHTRAYTVVADSPTVGLVALNRVDCLSPYFSFTARAQERIYEKNEICQTLAVQILQHQLRAFRRLHNVATNRNTVRNPFVIVQHKCATSQETPASQQFPRLRPAKWKADNKVVCALQQACLTLDEM